MPKRDDRPYYLALERLDPRHLTDLTPSSDLAEAAAYAGACSAAASWESQFPEYTPEQRAAFVEADINQMIGHLQRWRDALVPLIRAGTLPPKDML